MIKKVRKYIGKKYEIGNTKVTAAALFLLLISFIFLAVYSLGQSTHPAYYDTTAYLSEATFIDNHGGLLNFLKLCITGEYKQANQHPLFILVLTPFASHEISFLITAKLITAFIGFITLIVLYIITRKMFGVITALITLFAMSMNYVFVKWMGIVGVEMLLVLVSTICTYFVIAGFKNNKLWIYGGIFAGLAYLSKAPGLFFIPGFVLAGFVVYKFSILKNKYFWYFFLAFVVVSSPLLVRNMVVYNDPFFNVNKYIAQVGTEELFKTRYLEFGPEIGSALWKFEKVKSEDVVSAEESSYLDIIKDSSLFGNILQETKFFLATLNLNVTQSFLSSWMNFLFTVLLLALLVIGIFRGETLGGIIYFLSTVIIFIVTLSFVPSYERFYLPVIPFTWVYISFGLLTVLENLNDKFATKSEKSLFKYLPQLILLLLLLNVGYVLATKKPRPNPFKSVDYPENRAEIVNWFRSNLEKGDKYILGPNVNWQLEKGIWVLPTDIAHNDLSEFQEFIKRHKIKYVIIGKNNLIPGLKGHDHTTLTEDHFKLDKEQGVRVIKDVENWEPVYKSSNYPVDYIVFKVKN